MSEWYKNLAEDENKRLLSIGKKYKMKKKQKQNETKSKNKKTKTKKKVWYYYKKLLFLKIMT